MISRRFKRELPLHLMIWPGLIVLCIYEYVPMVGISMAFQDFKPTNGMFGSEWIGLDNFKFIFSLPAFNRALWNTVFIASMKIVAHLIIPLGVALLINEVGNRFIKRGIQTSIYLLHFVSWVILAGILLDMLSPSSGIVNQALGLIGIEPIFFLGDPRWFPYVLVISDSWKEFGFGTIIYLAALSGINPALYEAAHVDGAGRLRQTWNITLPGMRPIIVLLLTLSLGSVLSAGFDQVFNLYSPSVYQTGDIIDTMVYRMGLQQAQFSIATAIGLFKSFIALILISLSYWLAYRFADYRIFKEDYGMHKSSLSRKIFVTVNYTILLLLSLLCLFPVVHILAVSLSSSNAAQAGLVTIWPVDFTLKAYDFVLEKPSFLRAMGVSVQRVILGTAIYMLFTVCCAYPLSKEQHNFKTRTVYVWIFVFTILFGGGLIPWYMTIKYTGLLDTIWALVIPGAVPIFNIILLLNFFRGLPRELEDAAFIDGASHWMTLWKVHIPLSMPALATLILFTVVNHWNAWFDGIILMNNPNHYPLSSYLQTLLISDTMVDITPQDIELLKVVSNRTAKAAQIFLGTLPILMVYPFLQRYFIKGIVLGSVKE